jgi:hypothetical protein
MKSKILYSVVIGSIALALTAGAEQIKDKRSSRATPQQRAAHVQASRPARASRPASAMPATASAHRNVSAAPSRQRSYAQPRTGSNFVANRNARLDSMRERNAARNQAFRERTSAAFNHNRNVGVDRTRNINANRDRNVTVDRTRNFNVNRERNVAVNRARNADVNRFRNPNEFPNRNNNVAINRNRNVTVNRNVMQRGGGIASTRTNAAFYRGNNVRVTNNWRGNAFSGQRYTVFRNYNRQWHDRGWWTSHYNRIVFVNNGWWYWNAGYWFPAWGYAPYVTFAFDGPIYAYNGLTPDQVTVNVQEALAAAGYYDGPIDGELGPLTREAIANYQADNGLAVTSAIDEPTLATMGLV